MVFWKKVSLLNKGVATNKAPLYYLMARFAQLAIQLFEKLDQEELPNQCSVAYLFALVADIDLECCEVRGFTSYNRIKCSTFRWFGYEMAASCTLHLWVGASIGRSNGAVRKLNQLLVDVGGFSSKPAGIVGWIVCVMVLY